MVCGTNLNRNCFSYSTVKTLYDYEKPPESKEDPLVVYAVSAGYKWFFAYPEQKVETVNTLTIPKTVQLYLNYNLWIQ